MSYLLSKVDAKPVADPDPSKYMLLEIKEEDSSLAPMFRSADPEPIGISEATAAVAAWPLAAKIAVPVTAVGAVGGGLTYYLSQPKEETTEILPNGEVEIPKKIGTNWKAMVDSIWNMTLTKVDKMEKTKQLLKQTEVDKMEKRKQLLKQKNNELKEE